MDCSEEETTSCGERINGELGEIPAEERLITGYLNRCMGRRREMIKRVHASGDVTKCIKFAENQMV